MFNNKKDKIYDCGAKMYWTNHAQNKMRFYNLSEQRVRRVLNSSERIENGIAPNTIAMMQVAGNGKHPYEIWVMITKNQKYKPKLKNNEVKIISAWKYPGRTKAGEPLPEAILKEIREPF